MSMTIPKLADMVRKGDALTEKEREFIARMLMAVGQQFYERTGCMFICGHMGAMDMEGPGGMPEFLRVCPAYGADFRATRIYRLWTKDEAIKNPSPRETQGRGEGGVL